MILVRGWILPMKIWGLYTTFYKCDIKTVIWGLLIPLIGTTAGATCVFFLKKDIKSGVQRALTGFASGVMVAASIWSLIIPAIEQSADKGKWAFLPAFIGFWLGILFLLLLDHLIPHLHRNIDCADQLEGPKAKLNRTIMMVLAVTLHNIPEGMAVGVVYAGLAAGSANITAGVWRIDYIDCESCGSCDALFPFICSGSYVICGRGGTDPGDVFRGAFQYRCCIFCCRFQPDDGTGRCFGIKLYFFGLELAAANQK